MIDFGAIEVQIATHLQTKITDNDVDIVAVPEEDTQIAPAFGKRKIIVAFASEDAEPDENIGPVVQDVTITFSVLLLGKLLRGEKGLYPLAEAVKKTLTGFVPNDCRKLTYAGHKFVKNEEKVFQYVLDFKTISTRVEDTEDETSEDLFQSAVFNPIT